MSNTSSVFKALVLARGGFRRATKAAMLISAVVGLSGCSIIPGTSAMSMRVTDESAIKLPVVRNQEAVPENVAVKQITAELVIEQLKSGQVQFRRGALGGQTAAVRSAPPDVGLQNADYKLGPGDVINVTVWDHPELTIPAGSYRSAESSGTLVSDDGSIFYPYVGSMKVVGMSVRELRDALAKRLSKVIERVQLDVRVIVYRSKRVYVVGEVKNPGLQPINDIPMTLLEAISRAGGFSDEADHGNVQLTRAGKTYRVDVQALYEDGDASQNVLLQHGDILNVPDRQLNKIFVLGEVTKPGSYIMNKRRSTLAEALSDAGFLNAYTSAANWIYVMRSGEGKPELFHLNAGSPDALLLAERFPLLPRDVVYVDVSDLARWNRVVANILPTTTLLNSINAIQFPLLSNSRNGTSVISVPSTPAQ